MKDSKKLWYKYFSQIFVASMTALFIFPLIWMAMLSTNSRSDVYDFPPPMLPGAFVKENFIRLLDQIPYFMNLWNSTYVATLNSIIILFVCSFSAYGFSRFKHAPGNKFLFYIVVLSIMIPPLAGLVPWYMLMSWFGWINTHLPLIIPPAASAFGVFWMYQFISEAVPEELYESSKIDGASDWRVYWQIVIPLIRPGLGALAVLAFLNSWQNFQMPLVVLNDMNKFTIPLALQNLTTMRGTDIPALMLGTTISIIPIFIAFMLGTKHFISGLTSGSVKG